MTQCGRGVSAGAGKVLPYIQNREGKITHGVLVVILAFLLGECPPSHLCFFTLPCGFCLLSMDTGLGLPVVGVVDVVRKDVLVICWFWWAVSLSASGFL